MEKAARHRISRGLGTGRPLKSNIAGVKGFPPRWHWDHKHLRMATYASFSVCHPVRPKWIGSGNRQFGNWGPINPRSLHRLTEQGKFARNYLFRFTVCFTLPANLAYSGTSLSDSWLR